MDNSKRIIHFEKKNNELFIIQELVNLGSNIIQVYLFCKMICDSE